MTGAAPCFLVAMAHALDLRARPQADATVRRLADELVAARLAELLASDPRPAFRFRRGAVEYGPLPLAAFEDWPWAAALDRRGIGWLEIVGHPTPAMLDGFLDYAAGRMPEGGVPPRLLPEGIRWGPVEVPAEVAEEPLQEELTVMRQVFAAAAAGGSLPLGDVHAVAAALGALVEGGEPVALARFGRGVDYQPVHAVNTALLALVMGDVLGQNPEERHATAVSALLHDIGMVVLPVPGSPRFSPEDRERVQAHAVLGARLLLRQGDGFEEAAVVSYEHHLRRDGTGYPRLAYPREAHPQSRLVTVCDAFDALLAPRPDRPALEPLGALRHLEQDAVRAYDPQIVGVFSDVLLRAVAEPALTLSGR